MLSPCAAFVSKKRTPWTIYFCIVSLLKKAWNTLFKIFYLELYLPSKLDSWTLEGLNIRGYSPKGNIFWRCATRSLLWCIWKERNSRIFEDNNNS